MVRRAESDEHYVLDLCDEVLGARGRRQATFDWLRGDPSSARPRGTRLPVDCYWPDLKLVVEFQEEQHSGPSPFFDRRQTVSGVSRGEQRRLYDERKRLLIPAHALRLVVVEKSAFVVRSKRIVRDPAGDIAIVLECVSAADGPKILVLKSRGEQVFRRGCGDPGGSAALPLMECCHLEDTPASRMCRTELTDSSVGSAGARRGMDTVWNHCESWAYRARSVDPFEEGRVERQGTQKPARVLARFVAGEFEGKEK
jgi:hypothetical protein